MRKATGIMIACGVAALVGGRADAQTEAKTAPAAQSEAQPMPAAQLLASAQKQAEKEHKNVLVMFHASWCGWCKRLEGVMDKPEYKKLFADNYVIVPLDVSENGPKKALENAGGGKVMADLGGAKSGLPFYAFLNAKGKKLADSNVMPGKNGALGNIGYPGSGAEIAAFEDLLKKTAPKMKTDARKSLVAYLTQNSPEHPAPAPAPTVQ